MDGSPVSFAASSRYSADPRHVDVGNEIVRVGALEHEHPDRVVSLGLLEERDQVADQFRPQKIHWRSGDVANKTAPSLFAFSVSKFMGFSKATAVCGQPRIRAARSCSPCSGLFRASIALYAIHKRLLQYALADGPEHQARASVP